MAEKTESAETKKVVMNPRVEIDTSPPFESVKEAVDRFGGSGPWVPLHLLRLAAAHHDNEAFDMEKIEEQALQLERDLMMKEQQTHHVLQELEVAKRLVEGLKINLMPEFSSFMASPNLRLQVPNETTSFSPGMMFMELNQAKLNLNKTSVDLAVIQGSLESLNKKLRKDKILLERRSKIETRSSGPGFCLDENRQDFDKKIDKTSNNIRDVVSEVLNYKEVNFEAEQFKKMTEASRYEVMKAMAEIESTKNSIKMAEMRLNAAKKMEEAAKAVEAIALAEKRALLNGENLPNIFVRKNDEIMLSFEEYKSLTRKAKQCEELCKTKFIDTKTDEARHLEVPILEKFEETVNEERPDQKNVVIEESRKNFTKFKFRNSTQEKPGPGFRSTGSMGDVLSRKLVVQDDVMMGRRVEDCSEKERVSLSQMLREQSRLILHRNKSTTDGNVEKQYVFQRKKFGFIQVPVPTKQSKKKTQPMNMR